MNYNVMYGLAVGIAIVLAIIGAIQLADPAELGISPTVVAWTKVITPGLGILSAILPSVRKPPSDDRQGMD